MPFDSVSRDAADSANFGVALDCGKRASDRVFLNSVERAPQVAANVLSATRHKKLIRRDGSGNLSARVRNRRHGRILRRPVAPHPHLAQQWDPEHNRVDLTSYLGFPVPDSAPSFVKPYRCRDCGGEDGVRSHRRTWTERFILPLFLMRPVRCAACFRRDYWSVFHVSTRALRARYKRQPYPSKRR